MGRLSVRRERVMVSDSHVTDPVNAVTYKANAVFLTNSELPQ